MYFWDISNPGAVMKVRGKIVLHFQIWLLMDINFCQPPPHRLTFTTQRQCKTNLAMAPKKRRSELDALIADKEVFTAMDRKKRGANSRHNKTEETEVDTPRAQLSQRRQNKKAGVEERESDAHVKEKKVESRSKKMPSSSRAKPVTVETEDEDQETRHKENDQSRSKKKSSSKAKPVTVETEDEVEQERNRKDAEYKQKKRDLPRTTYQIREEKLDKFGRINEAIRRVAVPSSRKKNTDPVSPRKRGRSGETPSPPKSTSKRRKKGEHKKDDISLSGTVLQTRSKAPIDISDDGSDSSYSDRSIHSRSRARRTNTRDRARNRSSSSRR